MTQAPPRRSDKADASSSLREALFRFVPAFDSLRDYSLQVFARDTMAGLTVAAVAVPQAMAYAQIAGIPPQYGLYTAIVMTTVGALLDSSKQLINGPTNAISIAVLSALVGFGEDERLQAAILLALLVGVVQIGISLLAILRATSRIRSSSASRSAPQFCWSSISSRTCWGCPRQARAKIIFSSEFG